MHVGDGKLDIGDQELLPVHVGDGELDIGDQKLLLSVPLDHILQDCPSFCKSDVDPDPQNLMNPDPGQ